MTLEDIVKKFFKQLFCLHSSWARAGWKCYSSQLDKNYYVCKECHKVKNFKFSSSGWIALPNMPINFDLTDDTWDIHPELRKGLNFNFNGMWW